MLLDVYLVGQPDSLVVDEPRVNSAATLVESLRQQVLRHPTWVAIGGLVVHTQNIIAIDTSVDPKEESE